ncbi:MAG: uroporphyrinogen decarboxylase family protein [Planctomycetota bacterium]|jgi:uroporphyrinogen decarboxylase
MSQHIEAVKRAIEFRRPDYVPMEIIDVPHVYNAYHTLDPDTVQFIPGTEDFDVLWPCCYSWYHTVTGKTAEGEVLKEDQFGVKLKTPLDENSTYALLEHPLAGRESLEGYEFPNPDDLDPHFERLGNIIREKYPDRFISAKIDAGIFLTSQFLFGLEEFLILIASNPRLAVETYQRVAEYYRHLVVKYQRAGAHMITVFEDVGGTHGLLISPDDWRRHFRPTLADFYKFVHDQGLYTGILIDGNSGPILDDLRAVGIDVFSVVDYMATGLGLIQEKMKGKICINASIDMQHTLPNGTPEEIEQEADRLYEAFHSPDGGFISTVVRWHRPEYPKEKVLASVRGFNKYRP